MVHNTCRWRYTCTSWTPLLYAHTVFVLCAWCLCQHKVDKDANKGHAYKCRTTMQYLVQSTIVYGSPFIVESWSCDVLLSPKEVITSYTFNAVYQSIPVAYLHSLSGDEIKHKCIVTILFQLSQCVQLNFLWWHRSYSLLGANFEGGSETIERVSIHVMHSFIACFNIMTAFLQLSRLFSPKKGDIPFRSTLPPLGILGSLRMRPANRIGRRLERFW